jgi:hypothetical protein
MMEEKISRYISDINKKVKNKAWACIKSPGINSGYEFEGDGSYCVKF